MSEKTKKLQLEALLPPELSEGITPAEKILLHKAEIGEPANFQIEKENEDDLVNAPNWGPERIIRSEILFWLCTDVLAVDRVHPKGVRISGAVIPTKLDFSFCTLPHPLIFESCSVPGGFDFTDAHTRLFCLVSSTSGPVLCHRLQNDSDVNLEGTNIDGEVSLIGAKIKGQLDCSGAILKNADGDALSADSIAVEGSVLLGDGFQAEGEVSLIGAKIKGQLDCRGAILKNAGGYALSADRIAVEGSVFLGDGFQAEGEVRLIGATIKGQLDCRGAILKNAGGYALSADRIAVEGSVFLGDGFQAEGEVRLPGATIKGQLSCGGAILKNADSDALNAASISVEGDVFLRDGFQAEGEVSLIGAKIKGQLDCSGAILKNADGDALNADSIAVEGNVFLGDGFQAEGGAFLPGAKIKGQLDCSGAILKNAGGYAICCQNAMIKGTLFLQPLELEGNIDLLHAEVGQLIDDPKSWPKKGNLLINGFTYGAFSGSAPVKANKRLEWLALQPNSPFRPQTYEQLAKVYRSMGLEMDAKKVLIAKQEVVRQHGDLGNAAKAWNWILGKSIGHGYKSWRLLLYGIIPLIFLGWGVFWCADWQQVMQSTKENPSEFNAFVYSLDAFLPLVKLHQEEFWLPTTSKTYGSYFRLYLWVHIGLGWLLTTLFVVSLTGVVKKE